MKTHWHIGAPFLSRPVLRFPSFRQHLALVILLAAVAKGISPYAELARQHGWWTASDKFAWDFVADSEQMYRDGQQHTIRGAMQ